ncbi:MAG: T9SS type A sorting domain-containing protein [Flavobacteriales bacterium]|nr:T9SS type A sorting domain-containing protein [Flavobacteriales bacterium]
MKHFIILTLILLMVGNITQAQEYVRLMEEQNANFYDIQNAFYDHWDGKTYEKGKGWKQFKRWEWFMEPRVYPTGRIINPSLAYEEAMKFKNKYTPPKGLTNNKTANWTPIGPSSWNSIGWNPGIGRVNAITVDPNNSSIIYVGAPAGGCWKTTNGGSTWTPLTDNLSSLGVSGIAIDPNNSNIVYIATGDGDGNDTYSIGVMKSTDGGTTWNSTGLNWNTTQTRVMRKIIIDPSNSNVLFVATSTGLFKTSDAGANWTSVLSGSIRDVEFNPDNSNTVFACTQNLFYKSTNGGNLNTYTNITTGLPAGGLIGRLSIAVTPNDTNYIYILASDDNDASFYGLYRSTNGGDIFSLRTNTPNVFGYNTNGGDSGGQSWYDMALAVSPTNKNEVYTGGINVWKSTNGGLSLTALSQWNWPTGGYEYVHADIHTIDFYGNNLFVGSDGGIFKSINSGNTFTDITSGIQHSQFYRLGTSATDAGIIMAGAQDNGCTLLKNGSWTHVTGGDGMECIVDYSNPNIMYSTSQYGTIYKSTNGGNSFSGITGSITGSGAWVAPYTLDPVNPNTIYLGYEDVWKSTNGGNSWNTISNFPSSIDLKSLVVAPSNNNVIYAATNNIIYSTTNGGGNWTDITAGLPNNVITYITVHNLNPSVLWVSLSGFISGDKVYKSIDGGSNWINVSGNLPNLPINCVVFENGTNNGIYVGTDIGVYYKNDDLIQWQSYMTGLPNVIVNELEIHYGSGKIRSATFGRGVWESDLFTTTTPPIANLNTPDTTICPGNCARFTNLTINLGLNWQWYFPGGTPSTSTDLNPTVCYPSAGFYDVSLVVSNPIGSDSAYFPNYIQVQIPTTGIAIPLAEGFESSSNLPTGWSIINNDQGITWEHISTVGAYGLSSSCYIIDNFSSNFSGERDYLVTPELDFSSATNVEMTFDVAHAQWWSFRSDTLAVYYSTDCGVTKTLLWEKDGDVLATAADQPIYFYPTSTQWRNDTVNLNPIIGQSSVELFIENKSDNGNVIYLDNINIHEVTVGINEIEKNTITLYPNPFEHTLTINSRRKKIEAIEIYNVIGKLVYETNPINKSTNYQLKLNHLSSGFYVVKVTIENQIITKNLIKR